jgi:ribosomal protein L24
MLKGVTMAYKLGDVVKIKGGSYRGERGIVIKILKGGWYRLEISDRKVDAPENELEMHK